MSEHDLTFIPLSIGIGTVSGLASAWLFSILSKPEIDKTFLNQRKEKLENLLDYVHTLDSGFDQLKHLHDGLVTEAQNAGNASNLYRDTGTDPSIKAVLDSMVDFHKKIMILLEPHDYGHFFEPSFINMLTDYVSTRLDYVYAVLDGTYDSKCEHRIKIHADNIILYTSKYRLLKKSPAVKKFAKKWSAYGN